MRVAGTSRSLGRGHQPTANADCRVGAQGEITQQHVIQSLHGPDRNKTEYAIKTVSAGLACMVGDASVRHGGDTPFCSGAC